MNGIADILSTGQFPGVRIRHPAGQKKYYSQLAEFSGDKRAEHTCLTDAKNYAASRGWEVKEHGQTWDRNISAGKKQRG